MSSARVSAARANSEEAERAVNEILANISSEQHVRVRVNDLVAYEYVDQKTKSWRWGLGTVAGLPGPRLVQLMLWASVGEQMPDAPPAESPISPEEREQAARELRTIEAQKKKVMGEVEELNKTMAERQLRYAAGKEGYEQDLAKAEETLRDVQRHMRSLAESDWREIRNYIQPPAVVELVLEATMLTLGEKTYSWNDIRRVLRSKSFITQVTEFDPANVSQSSRRKLVKYLNNPRFTYEDAMLATRALGALHRWVTAQLDAVQVKTGLTNFDAQRRKDKEELDRMQQQMADFQASLARYDAEENRLRGKLGDAPVTVQLGAHPRRLSRSGSRSRSSLSPSGHHPHVLPGGRRRTQSIFGTQSTWSFTDETITVLKSSILVDYDRPRSTTVTLTPEQVELLRRALEARAAPEAQEAHAEAQRLAMQREMDGLVADLAEARRALMEARRDSNEAARELAAAERALENLRDPAAVVRALAEDAQQSHEGHGGGGGGEPALPAGAQASDPLLQKLMDRAADAERAAHDAVRAADAARREAAESRRDALAAERALAEAHRALEDARRETAAAEARAVLPGAAAGLVNGGGPTAVSVERERDMEELRERLQDADRALAEANKAAETAQKAARDAQKAVEGPLEERVGNGAGKGRPPAPADAVADLMDRLKGAARAADAAVAAADDAKRSLGDAGRALHGEGYEPASALLGSRAIPPVDEPLDELKRRNSELEKEVAGLRRLLENAQAPTELGGGAAASSPAPAVARANGLTPKDQPLAEKEKELEGLRKEVEHLKGQLVVAGVGPSRPSQEGAKKDSAVSADGGLASPEQQLREKDREIERLGARIRDAEKALAEASKVLWVPDEEPTDSESATSPRDLAGSKKPKATVHKKQTKGKGSKGADLKKDAAPEDKHKELDDLKDRVRDVQRALHNAEKALRDGDDEQPIQPRSDSFRGSRRPSLSTAYEPSPYYVDPNTPNAVRRPHGEPMSNFSKDSLQAPRGDLRGVIDRLDKEIRTMRVESANARIVLDEINATFESDKKLKQFFEELF